MPGRSVHHHTRRSAGHHAAHRPPVTGAEGGKLIPIAACERFITADIAGTEKKAGQKGSDPDYTVFACWDLAPEGELILVDVWRDRKQEPDVVREGLRFYRECKARWALIEKNGMGSGVISTLFRRGIAVRGYQATENKLLRAQTAIVRMETGGIYFPETLPGIDDLILELVNFPNGAHDDFVDTVSLAAMYAQNWKGVLDDEGDAAYAEQSAASRQGKDAAYEEGREARTMGLKPVNNPHADGTAEHLAWDAGWAEADEEAREQRERRRGDSMWVGFGDED